MICVNIRNAVVAVHAQNVQCTGLWILYRDEYEPIVREQFANEEDDENDDPQQHQRHEDQNVVVRIRVVRWR